MSRTSQAGKKHQLAPWALLLAALRRSRQLRREPREIRPAAPVGGALGAFRAVALWGIAVLIITAAGAAIAESYRSLWLWAEHHGLAGFWAVAFPLQIDLFVAVGELVLFVAVTDRWGWRDRSGAWAVALLGLAASVAGNVGHVAAHDLQSRGTAAVPPLAAFAALWLGLGVLKRVVKRHPARALGERDTPDDESAQPESLGNRHGGPVVELLAELPDAVRSPAKQDIDAVPSSQPGTGETALLADLLGAVRDLSGQVGGAVSSPVPSDAEHAALIALRSTMAAGNPFSDNQLSTRFGLTRAQTKKVRRLALGDDGERHEEAAAKALLGLDDVPVGALRTAGESDEQPADAAAGVHEAVEAAARSR